MSRTSKVCVKSNQIPYEVAVIESEGQVYRKNTDKRVYVVQGGLTWMPTTSFKDNWANANACPPAPPSMDRLAGVCRLEPN